MAYTKNPACPIGKKFNKLTVLSLHGKSKHGDRMYLCRCDCGREIITRYGFLNSGNKKSCGCASSAYRYTEEYERKMMEKAKRKTSDDSNKIFVPLLGFSIDLKLFNIGNMQRCGQ